MTLANSSQRGWATLRRRSFMAQPVKHPKSGIYQLRRKVPEELRTALGHEYKRSLKTADAAEAKARFAAAWTESEEAFALARAQSAGGAILSQRDAEQIAARWFKAERDRLERSGRFTDLLWSAGKGYIEGEACMTLAEAAEERGYEDVDFAEMALPYMRRALRENNLPMPASKSVAHDRLVSAFVENLHKLSEWALKRHEGERQPQTEGIAAHEPIEVERKASEAPTPRVRKLGELFDAYSEDKKLTDGDSRATRKTINAYRVVVERFVELHGDLDVREIDRELIAAHRSALAKLPAKGDGIRALAALQLIERAQKEGLPLLSEPTIRNRLRAISAVLSYGVRHGWLHENPVIASGAGRAAAKAATRRQAADRRRKEYTREELTAIFSSPVFSEDGWTPPRANFGNAWYWLPLMLYYTGARREELAQLRVSDIRQSDGGVWHLSILAVAEDDDGTRGVKTAGSRRFVPLHTDLIKRGFISYLVSLPASGQLFPLLRPDPNGYFGTNFGKRWAAYLRNTVRLRSPASPSHGFRHSFKTLSREAGISEEVHDAITGHTASGAVSRDYGSMPLSTMAEAIARIPAVNCLGNG